MGDTTFDHRSPQAEFGDLSTSASPPSRRPGSGSQRLVENHLYFSAHGSVGQTNESWRHVRDALKPMMPPVAGPLILKIVRKPS